MHTFHAIEVATSEQSLICSAESCLHCLPSLEDSENCKLQKYIQNAYTTLYFLFITNSKMQ